MHPLITSAVIVLILLKEFSVLWRRARAADYSLYHVAQDEREGTAIYRFVLNENEISSQHGYLYVFIIQQHVHVLCVNVHARAYTVIVTTDRCRTTRLLRRGGMACMQEERGMDGGWRWRLDQETKRAIGTLITLKWIGDRTDRNCLASAPDDRNSKCGIQFSKLDHDKPQYRRWRKHSSLNWVFFQIESRRALDSRYGRDEIRRMSFIILPRLRSVPRAFIASPSRIVNHLTVSLDRSRRAFVSVATIVVQYLRQLLIRAPRSSPYTSKLRTAANRNFDWPN